MQIRDSRAACGHAAPPHSTLGCGALQIGGARRIARAQCDKSDTLCLGSWQQASGGYPGCVAVLAEQHVGSMTDKPFISSMTDSRSLTGNHMDSGSRCSDWPTGSSGSNHQSCCVAGRSDSASRPIPATVLAWAGAQSPSLSMSLCLSSAHCTVMAGSALCYLFQSACSVRLAAGWWEQTTGADASTSQG